GDSARRHDGEGPDSTQPIAAGMTPVATHEKAVPPGIDETERKEHIVTHIMIVDDHAVVRQGVRQILSEQFQDAVIGEAASAQELMEQMRRHNWDVVVLDVGMPGKSGLDALKDLKQAYPKLPILVLSAYPEDQLAR